MDPALSSIAVVTGYVAVLLVGAAGYFRRVRVERPPIGVFTGRDVVVITVVLVVVPPLYLHLPVVLVATILTLVALVILRGTLVPWLGRAAGGLVTAALAAACVTLALTGPPAAFLAVNDAAVVLLVLGVANLYVQSGLTAGAVAAFAAVLTGYDAVVTGLLPMMVDFVTRIEGLPFGPVLAWGSGTGVVGIGMGDLLLVTLWMLAVEKAYGRRPAALAGAVGLLGALGLFLAFWFDLLNTAVPAMLLFGPLIVVHRLVLRRRGPERTAAQYLRATAGLPPVAAAVSSPAAAHAAVTRLLAAGPPAVPSTGPVRYLVLDGDEVLGTGATAGAALRAARPAPSGAVPVVVQETGAQ